MNNFGKIKSKLLKKITEAYEQGELKNNTKNLIKVVKKNKDFKEMYMFYEEIENKYFDDKEVAKLYVEEIGSILKQKSTNVKKFCEVINMSVHDTQIDENELYDSIDQLLEEDSLKNLDKKIIAKKKLIEHLTTKKDIKESEQGEYTANENLLHAVLTNNFNVLYMNNMNEEQKEELKNILSISDDDLLSKTNELKESITIKVGSLLSESSDEEFNSKLRKVKDEIDGMNLSKYNYYRLTQLKNGLD
jgi:succinate dehydrogenase flavin-adding protein (antitoxin of CptAB toxin-antitoxin module)